MESVLWVLAFVFWLVVVVGAYVWVLRWLWTSSPFATVGRVVWTVLAFFPVPFLGLLVLIAVRLAHLGRTLRGTSDVPVGLSEAG